MNKAVYLIVFGLAFLAGSELLAQAGQYHKKKPDLFPGIGEFSNKGWYITPGVTYMAGFGSSERHALGGDTLMIQVEEPAGKFGAFLQLGRFHAVESRWLTYIDYGLDVRWLQGLHNRRLETRLGADNPDWLVAEGGGSFSDLWVGLSFNATVAKPLTKTVYLHHSLGVNANYAVLRSLNPSAVHGISTTEYQPPVVNGQIHYKLGVGFKLGRGWYLIPSVETPIIGVYAWNGAIPSLKYFDTYYQPILIGLTIMKLDRSKPGECPTEGNSNRKRKKGPESGLFDKKVNKKYGW